MDEAMTQVSHGLNILAYSYTGINSKQMHSIRRSYGKVASMECPASVPMFPSQHPCHPTLLHSRFQQRKPHLSGAESGVLRIPGQTQRVEVCMNSDWRTYSCETPVYIQVLETCLYLNFIRMNTVYMHATMSVACSANMTKCQTLGWKGLGMRQVSSV